MNIVLLTDFKRIYRDGGLEWMACKKWRLHSENI